MKVASAIQSSSSAHVLPISSSQKTSAKAIISQLGDSSAQPQAIKLLIGIVDFFWPEIAESSAVIEKIAEVKNEVGSQACLLLAKLNFHLGDYDKSMDFALSSEDCFSIEEQSQFAETIVAAILDKYASSRVQGSQDVEKVLEGTFARVVDRCLRDRELKQLIGLALDSRRLDVLNLAITSSSSPEEASSLLYYTRQTTSSLKNCVEFQDKVLNLVIELFMKLPKLDYVFICDCFISTNQPTRLAEAINFLAEKDETIPEAVQLAFNVQADATQEFLAQVQAALKISDTQSLASMKDILSGKVASRLFVEFLSSANHTDPLILEKTKNFLNPQMSLHQQALSCANGFLQAGTTNDEFLRKNLDFLSHANNWAKFSAAASLGSIHRGQLERSRELLAAYLPKPGAASKSIYSEGGALMALGLIHSNHGSEIFSYLMEQLSSSESEIIQHGACLGLGASGIASRNEAALEAIKGILYADNAVAGEAGGISMGLLMLGSGDEGLVEELLQYAHESQHEKIIRSLSLGIALICYSRQDRADSVIAQMEAEKDPIIRYGAVWTTALAYVGTSSNVAISKLLHFAVSDANDDVRRAAVTSLGFVLFRNPEELPRLVELLSESYNPSVRYGAAMALGIAFAGTADKRALDLIAPMFKDLTDYVRQGALIAQAMILMQHNDCSASSTGSLKSASGSSNSASAQVVTNFRKQLEQIIGTRHEDPLVKFGAVLAQGIIDAGGRNVRLALTTPSGHISMSGVTGVALFCQFWYWYPFAHFLPLGFAPTALVAVTPKLPTPLLLLPKLAVISSAPASLFAYPEATKPVVNVAPKKAITAILSTTARAAARAKRIGDTSKMAMSIEDANETEKAPIVDNPEDCIQKSAPAALPEANFVQIDNLTRVIPTQIEKISFPHDSRFKPVPALNSWRGGILVLRDTLPDAGTFETHELSDAKVEQPNTTTTNSNSDVDNSNNQVRSPSSAKSPKLDPSAMTD